MHAHEINDWKIDPKFDISPENSIGYMLEHGIVTLPEQLTLKDCSSIYASILKAEAQVLRGYPLAQTIYTFMYTSTYGDTSTTVV